MQSFLIQLNGEDLKGIVSEAVLSAISRYTPSQPEQPEDVLLTQAETAKMLHVAKATLISWGKQGIIKPRTIGRRVLYSKQEVLAKMGGVL